ncbi:MAG: bacteriohemerythrin [Defluviitaleaceae bacterium]|nr:bacteriohemerythrin [Defluviitaleaceae bacterium]
MWKDSYLTGVATIDKEHMQLFETVGKLKDTLTQGLGFEDYKAAIIDTMEFLKKYCLKHFADEEKFYRDAGYDGVEEHRQFHLKLIADVLDHQERLKQSNFDPTSVKAFLGFLLTWLIYHVAGEDQKMSKPKISAVRAQTALIAFADNVREVLATVTGIANDSIKPIFNKDINADDGIIFKVGLVGDESKKAVWFVYSNKITFGIFRAMTGMEVCEANEMAYSALQEISNIASAKISNVLSAACGKFVDIDYPVAAKIDDIPKTGDSFVMNTTLGDMEIIVK